jgi:hypothetical protein
MYRTGTFYFPFDEEKIEKDNALNSPLFRKKRVMNTYTFVSAMIEVLKHLIGRKNCSFTIKKPQ